MPCYQLLSVAPSYWLALPCTKLVTTRTPSAWSQGPNCARFRQCRSESDAANWSGRSVQGTDCLHIGLSFAHSGQHRDIATSQRRPDMTVNISFRTPFRARTTWIHPGPRFTHWSRQPGLHAPCGQPSACFQNTARIPRLHRQSGLSTPLCLRRNAGSSTPAPHPRPWANRTNRRTRIQNVLTRGATTFTDGRTSTGLCDYPVLPSANSRHMPSTGTHIHDQRCDYTTATTSHCWRNSTSPTNLQKASESRQRLVPSPGPFPWSLPWRRQGPALTD